MPTRASQRRRVTAAATTAPKSGSVNSGSTTETLFHATRCDENGQNNCVP